MAGEPVAGGAVVGETPLALRRVAVARIRVLRVLARVLHSLARAAGLDRAELSVQAEQPEVVAVLCRRQTVAARVESDVFLSAVLEDRRRVVRAGPGLEAPALLAAARVVGLELAVVAPDEDDVSRGRHGTRVARVLPLGLPGDPAGRHVEGRERPWVLREARDRPDRGEVR